MGWASRLPRDPAKQKAWQEDKEATGVLSKVVKDFFRPLNGIVKKRRSY
jgi:hypothetical protein